MSNIKDYRAEREGDLTRGQSHRLKHLVGGIIRAIESRLDDEQNDARLNVPTSAKIRPDLETVNSVRRPNNVFCIDGGRGSGKTHLLITLDHILSLMSGNQLNLTAWKKVVPIDYWMAIEERLAGRVAIKPLRIIFPADLDKQEYVMEAVFAALREDLDLAVENERSSTRRLQGEKIRRRLINDVAAGQYFARRFGVETVMRDSVNFEHLVKQWDDLNIKAANRTEVWREFIDEYMNWSNICSLAILLDDSDQRPEVTYDILQTARNMFNHPQIICVIAGNTRAMRNSLIQLSMRALADVMPALNAKEHPTGDAWRRSERRQVEQIIEKILPEAKRYYLPPMEPTDFRRVLGVSLDEIVSAALRGQRQQFMRTKMLSSYMLELKRTDVPTPRGSAILEDYISWWLFQTQYGGRLRPFSARQARTFGEYYAEYALEGGPEFPPGRNGDLGRAKRLSVALFENSQNFALLQRFEDHDNNVTEWLGRQQLASEWGEQRAFIVDGRRIAAGTYSHDFLCYRLDVGLSLPLRDNPESLVPSEFLPEMRGRKRMRQFYRPATMPTRPRLLGIGGKMEHAAVPGNCLYFYQLSALPAVAFVTDPNDCKNAKVPKAGGTWEAGLHASWTELFARDQDEYLQNFIITSLSKIHKHQCENGIGKPPASAIVVQSTSLLLEKLRSEAKTESTSYTNLLKRDLSDDPKIIDGDPQSDLARRSALVTDLRRAWHALRVWQVSRVRPRDEDSHSVTSQSLMARISSSDRMELYTLEKFIAELRKDDWVSGMLDLFEIFADPTKATGDRSLDDVREASFLHQLKLPRPSRPQAAAELSATLPLNSNDWAQNWRDLGRLMCTHWPEYSKSGGDRRQERGRCKIVEKIFQSDENNLRIKIFPDGENDERSDELRNQKYISVRAFV